ncbi:aspartate/glutamate racemase family protein [Marinobacterium rhizophilum]|uniref:Aspartate/glutamate racemase family protein n=1 Tax=Marinobacterium rhizophilum TaxID=420402 RepID=A0ABY5HM22_9GAMM|nr:aspartate/glutamate racemase family protein [Marinobacterium rhizophilum]UTW12302.1 aspartate/glutamate racemase family protein [Marinobacterium rhizophilum]
MSIRPIRILIINPNTNPAVTQQMKQAASAVASSGTEVVAVNPVEGPFSIESRDDRDRAEVQLLTLVAEQQHQGFDAYVLACFDDIALDNLRALTGAPVVGMFEAGVAAARTLASRFSIVTTVHAAVPTIEALLGQYGASGICRVRAAGIGVAAAAGSGQEAERKIAEAIRDSVEQDAAQAILLGSGGLTGRAAALEQAFSLPVIDGVVAAVKMAEGVAHMRLMKG